jgi:hypothetical protein
MRRIGLFSLCAAAILVAVLLFMPYRTRLPASTT